MSQQEELGNPDCSLIRASFKLLPAASIFIMLCSICIDIFKTPLEFKSRMYKRSVDLHRDSATSDNCYMCDCIWRSFVTDDENVDAVDSVDYSTSYRFIDLSAKHGHPGLLALAVSFNHRSGRFGNPTRRYYPAFYVEPVTGQSRWRKCLK